MSKSTGTIDGAKKTHQNGQTAHRLKSVGMRRKTAHGMEGHGSTHHVGVLLAPGVSPGNGKFKRLLKGRMRQFFGQLPNARCRNARLGFRPFGRGFAHLALQKFKAGRNPPTFVGPIGDDEFTLKRKVTNFTGFTRNGTLAAQAPCQFILGKVFGDDGSIGVKQKKTVISTFVENHQVRAVGITLQKFPIHLIEGDEFMHKRQKQSAIRSRANRNPFVSDG